MQFVGNLPTSCLCVFDHFMGLAHKGLKLKNVAVKYLAFHLERATVWEVLIPIPENQKKQNLGSALYLMR